MLSGRRDKARGLMIYIALGANLPHPRYGPAQQTLVAALDALDALATVSVVAVSGWYETAPVPMSDQPWYVNAVARVDTGLDPAALLDVLHRIEADFGRVRQQRNAARMIDLDLLDYCGRSAEAGGGPILPHPRLHQRAFVLYPLRDLAPDWRHPRSGRSVSALIAALPAGQSIRRLSADTAAF